ncbi:LPS-assembly protein LptD [Hippea maritima]|uniref:Organic solvent tolerance protein n=1 Tax=Hippea maritima (strain ATCC 700847 / DSM 10411 / MH2) TaxID=760142 RepID=F2LV12_HIPMA|nr:putative LPS assembly protein LptD [Hippea maritima]AEA33596.1 Organic solvent tolerance protein [Hippea maritima DSM 10411]
MRKAVFLTSLFLLLFIQITAFASDSVVHIKANHVSYNKQLNTYYAYGSCLIYDENYTLKADKVSYNTKTSIATAKGNVILTDKKNNWIKGKEAALNYSTYKGYIKNAVLFSKNNGVGMYIRAKKIIVYSKNRYFIKDGIITTCKCQDFINFKDDSSPKWSIKAHKTYVVKGDYLFAYPVIFKAKKMPIFFSPFFYRNLDKRRKTGFLMPQIGSSNINGFEYIQPFFINLSPSQDITLYPFTYSRKGNGVKGQYRFYWTKHSKGEWNITIFKEKVPYESEKNKKTRINIKANQYADFGNYGIFKYDINLVNHKNNLRVINANNIKMTSDRYTTSKASYYISKSNYYLSLYSEYNQDLISENNRETLQKLPSLRIGIINKKLYKNLTLDFSESTTNNFRIKGNRGISSDTTAFLSYPAKISYFNFTPKVGIHQLYARWENAPDNEKFTRRSFIPDYILSTSTTIDGIFLNNNTEGFKGIKHSIKPTLKYEYIPDRDQSKFPDFVSTYSKTNQITFTFENSLTAKYLSNQSPVYKNMLYNKFEVKYDFSHNYHTPFPPVYEQTIIKPFNFLTINSQAHYFFKKHVFTDSSEDVDINIKRFGFSFGHTMARDSNYNLTDDTIKGKVYIYPVKSLYLYTSAQRSTIHNYFPSRKIGFLYQEDCWGIGLDLYFNRESEEQEDGSYKTVLNKGFWITLNLTGLFTIKKQY